MVARRGKPCGASHIANSKVCRVGMPTAVNNAINAATGEIGAASLKAAVQKYAGGQGVSRLREIRREIREEMGGNIVRGPKADELKRRLQEEGLLPPKRSTPRSVPPSIKRQLENLAAQEKPKAEPQEWKPEFLSKKNKGEDKPDPLWGDWDTDRLQKMERFFENKEPGKKRDEQLQRIRGELARREKKSGGKTEREMSDIERIMRGEEPKYMDVVSDAGELGMGLRAKSKSEVAQLQSALGLGPKTRKDIGRDLEGLRDEALAEQARLVQEVKRLPAGPEQKRAVEKLNRINKALEAKTAASAGTRYARESARDFDEIMKGETLRRDGDASFDRWDETTGRGAKKLGSGAYGTVVKNADGTYAVKRGDISDSEARLIQKIGNSDLGPKLIAADVDGPGSTVNPGVDVRRGRMAMSIVPGKPIGYKEPDAKMGGERVADAFWRARANLHRLGVAHNDMHTDNVLIDKNGKGRFVDMGLAQDSPKAALAEALGAFTPPRGAAITRNFDAAQPGDWQVKRWKGTGGQIMEDIARGRPGAREELQERAPVAARVWENKNALQYRMRQDGYSLDDIGTLMAHGIRSKPSSYNRGVWSRMSDDQAREYINMLYDGV